jgi:hypothetical protein
MYTMQSPASSPDFMDPRYSQLRMSASSSKWFSLPTALPFQKFKVPKSHKTSQEILPNERIFNEQKV